MQQTVPSASPTSASAAAPVERRVCACRARVSLPYTVEHVAILGNPQQLIVRGDLVEVGALLIGEEQIRLPDGIQHRGIQVQGIIGVLAVGQPRIVPLLPQEDVHPVVLWSTLKSSS